MNHPLKPVQRGQARGRCYFQICKNIIFNDHKIGFISQLEQPVGCGRAQNGPSWIMDRRVGDIEARLMGFQGLCKMVEVRTGWCIGNADHMNTMGFQKGMEIKIAGIVHQHCIAGLQKETAQQVDCLGARFCQDRLLQICKDPISGHAASQIFPERYKTTRRAIVRQCRWGCPRQRTQGTPQAVFGHPGCRKPAAAGL